VGALVLLDELAEAAGGARCCHASQCGVASAAVSSTTAHICMLLPYIISVIRHLDSESSKSKAC
jgi:hypothetical protein